MPHRLAAPWSCSNLSRSPSVLWLLELSVLPLVGACVPEFDEDLTLIQAPRILAIQAVPAEVAPGATVNLKALVAAPDGASVADPNWSLCEARKRLTELGPVEQTCLEGEDVRDLGAGPVIAAPVSVDVCRMFGPIRPDPVDNLPAGRAVEPDSTGGFYQPVIVALDDELTLASVRLSCGLLGIPSDASLVLSRGFRPNQNPELGQLRAGKQTITPEADLIVRAGAELDWNADLPRCPEKPVCGDGVCSVEEDKLECAEDCTGALGCAGAEYFVQYDPASRQVEVQREELTLSWFASVGAWGSAKTDAADATSKTQVSHNTWHAPDRAAQGKLWVVVRDNRGGVGWSEVKVVVR